MCRRVLYQLLTVIIIFFSAVSTSQGQDRFQDRKAGRVFVSWGWNRAAYGKSTISFKGADYDFKLEHLTAHDRPTKISYQNYLKFSRLTIPQTNLRISYFIKDNLAISFGDDHMKYVMDNDQTVMMKGSITRPGVFQGEYNGPKKVTRDFLLYEHTDGLNYLNFELEKYADLFRPGKKVIFSWFYGGGAGVLMPKTNVTLLDYERNDRFHVSGFVLGTIAVLIKQEFLLVFIGGVYVIELMSVVLQVGSFKLRGKRIFKMAPLHHHFEALGWSETKIVIRFWVAGLVMALFALTTLKLR